MVIFAFIHVFFIVVDRVIYIMQNRNIIQYKYYYFNNITGEKLCQENYSKMKFSEEESKQYKMIYLQIEQINIPLICKYVLHWFMILFTHFMIFWFFPIKGNLNQNGTYECDKDQILANSCNDFMYNGYIILCYILYLFYLFFSALQIK